MSKKYVCVTIDLHCEWEGLNPAFRVYVNDELFTERTWRWENSYLEETLQLRTEPGDYQITYEIVPPHLATLTVTNLRIVSGNATLINANTVRIQ